MSNIFKSNSRFAGLIDNHEFDKNTSSVKLMKKMGWKEGKGLGKNQDGIKEPIDIKKYENNSGIGFKSDEKHFNTFKENGFRERIQNNRYPTDREVNRLREEYAVDKKIKKDIERQEEERLKQESLKIENFPELLMLEKNYGTIKENSYIDKLKKTNECKNKSDDHDLDNLQPGCILIKKDKLTGKTVIKHNKIIDTSNVINQEDYVLNVLNSLSDLHDRRSQEYIDLNGYDDWEKKFKCVDWREWQNKYDDDSDSDIDDEGEDTENDEDQYFEMN